MARDRDLLLGGWAGVVGAIALLGPTLVGSIALGVIFGGLLGAYGGAWVGRSIVDRLSPRGDPADSMGQRGPRP